MRRGEEAYEGVGISFMGRKTVWATKSTSLMKKWGYGEAGRRQDVGLISLFQRLSSRSSATQQSTDIGQ